MAEKDFFNRALEVSTEFDKFVLVHPEIAEKIPQDALLVFMVEDDPEFNEWAMQVAHARREPAQPVAVVKVQKLLPPFESRLVNPRVELSVAF